LSFALFFFLYLFFTFYLFFYVQTTVH